MRKTVLSSLVLCGLLSGACVIAIEDPAAQGQHWPHDSFRKSLSLKSGGSVSLENGDGDIMISGTAEDKVEIYAQHGRKAAPSAGIHFIGSWLSQPDVHVRTTPDSVRIKTGESGYGEEGGAVHYVLNVPRFTSLDSVRNGRGRIAVSDIYGRAVLDAVEGEVRISNYSGSLDIRLGNGLVEAEVLDLRPKDSIRIKVERGDIVLVLEANVAAQLMADAPAGNVTSELDLGQALPAQRVSARLAEGQAPIELTAVRGDIKIRKVEEVR